jgi:hypothetical protein
MLLRSGPVNRRTLLLLRARVIALQLSDSFVRQECSGAVGAVLTYVSRSCPCTDTNRRARVS